MFKNRYEINGDITKILITQRNGNKYIALIDTKDLQRLIDNHFSVYIRPNRNNQLPYPLMNKVKSRVNGRNTYTSVQLNRFILNVTNDVVVDHINHDTLDNRKENLRAIEPTNNSTNRKTHNKNNKSGYRNVAVIDDKFVVQLEINGKNTKLGEFTNADKAGIFAEQMRQKYYGEYAGNS